MWRRRVFIELSIAAGVLFQDGRLALAYGRGEMIRVVIDKKLGNGLAKSHLTQIPSAEDTLAILCWGMIHAAIAVYWCRAWASRRAGQEDPTRDR